MRHCYDGRVGHVLAVPAYCGAGELQISTGLAAYCTVTVSFTDDPLGEWYGCPVGWQLSTQVSCMDNRLVGRHRWVVAVFGV